MSAYDLKSLNLPRLYGKSLRLFAALAESAAGRAFVIGGLLENGGNPAAQAPAPERGAGFLPAGASGGARRAPVCCSRS